MTENAANGSRDVGDGWDADDVSLSAAMARVEVPAGARRRALERLRAELSRKVEAETDPVTSVELAQRPIENAGRRGLTSKRFGRRSALRIMVVATAAAACIAIYVSSLPLTQANVTTHCTQIVAALGDAPAWQTVTPESLARLAPLKKLENVRQQLLPMGAMSVEASGVAEGCTLFKFASRSGKVVYVFDFVGPRSVAGLNSQLQVMSQSSSGWSTAALQTSDQLLVVVAEGELGRFFRSSPLA